MSLRDSLLVTLVAVVWGVNFVVIDWGMEGVPPLLFAALRFTLVALPAVFFVPRPRVPLRAVVLVGVFMSLGQFGFLYTSIHLGMPPGLAALVLQAQVMLTVLIAAGWLREAPALLQGVGIAVGGAGLVLVGAGRGGDVPLVALLLCLCAALCWAIGNVVARRAGAPSGLSMVVWSAVFVPVPMFALTLGVDGPQAVLAGLGSIGWPAVASTLYTVVLSSLFGYSVWNALLAKHHASSVVPFVLLVPPVAMLTAWLAQGEVPNLAETLGGLLVLVGVGVTMVRSRGDRARGAAHLDAGPRGGRHVHAEQARPTEVVALVDDEVCR